MKGLVYFVIGHYDQHSMRQWERESRSATKEELVVKYYEDALECLIDSIII